MKPGAHSSIRSGSLLVEVIVAFVLLGTLISVVGQTTIRVRRQATITRQRLKARETLRNQMTRAIAELGPATQPGAEAVLVPEEASQGLQELTCWRRIQDFDEGWHVIVRLTWKGPQFRDTCEMSLASWVPKLTAASPRNGATSTEVSP